MCPLMKGTGDYHPEPDRAWSMPACDPTQTWDCAAQYLQTPAVTRQPGKFRL